MSEGRESKTATALLVGVGLVVVGAMLATHDPNNLQDDVLPALPYEQTIGEVILVAGIALVAIAIACGFIFQGSQRCAGSRRIQCLRIQAIYGFDRSRNMIFGDLDTAVPDEKLFVRIGLPDGTTEELRSS